MSKRYLARKNPTPIITTGEQLRRSVIELREIYSNLTVEEFAAWFENRYKVKKEEVKRILGSVENAD